MGNENEIRGGQVLGGNENEIVIGLWEGNENEIAIIGL